MKKVFLLLIFLLPLLSANPITLQDEYLKLVVNPESVFHWNNDFNQNFKLTVKQDYPYSLWFAFVFNKKLTKAEIYNLESKTIQDFNLGWVSNSFQCNNDFNYSLNVNPDSVNPHLLNCFISDSNGVYYIKKDFPFYSGDPQTKTVNFYEWKNTGELIDKTVFEYVNRSSFFNHYESLNGKHYYYINTPLDKNYYDFTISYKPALNDFSKKWDLIAWAGNSFDCIFFDSCVKTWWIDPFFYSGTTKYSLNIQGTHDAFDVNTTVFARNLDLSGIGCTDINQLIVVYDDTNSELAREIEGSCASTDANIMFRFPTSLTANTDFNEHIFLYFMGLDSTYSTNKAFNQVYLAGDNFDLDTRGGYTINGGSAWSDAGIVSLTSGTAQNHLAGNLGKPPSAIVIQTRMSATVTNYGSSHCLNFLASGTSARGHCIEDRDPAFYTSQPNVSANTSLGVNNDANQYFTLQYVEFADNDAYASTINTNADDLNSSTSAKTSEYRNRLTTHETGFADYSYTYFGIFSGSATGYIDWFKVFKYLTNEGTVLMGSAQSDVLAPDVNLNYPNGAEIFYKGSAYDINFSVQDGDSNSLLVDLNIFQDSNNFILIDDVNTDSATILCEDSDFSNSTACLYSWTVQAGIVSGDWNLTVLVSDGSNNANDSTDANFTITTAIPTVLNESGLYVSESDSRLFHDERYFDESDKRLQDTLNFVEKDDKRQKADFFSVDVLFKSMDNIFIVVIVIILLGVGFLWIRK